MGFVSKVFVKAATAVNTRRMLKSSAAAKFIKSAKKQNAEIIHEELYAYGPAARTICKRLPSGTEVTEVYDKTGARIGKIVESNNFDRPVDSFTRYSNGKVAMFGTYDVSKTAYKLLEKFKVLPTRETTGSMDRFAFNDFARAILRYGL